MRVYGPCLYLCDHSLYGRNPKVDGLCLLLPGHVLFLNLWHRARTVRKFIRKIDHQND